MLCKQHYDGVHFVKVKPPPFQCAFSQLLMSVTRNRFLFIICILNFSCYLCRHIKSILGIIVQAFSCESVNLKTPRIKQNVSS